jgi:hypothetical protein
MEKTQNEQRKRPARWRAIIRSHGNHIIRLLVIFSSGEFDRPAMSLKPLTGTRGQVGDFHAEFFQSDFDAFGTERTAKLTNSLIPLTEKFRSEFDFLVVTQQILQCLVARDRFVF